ncbi:MAG TPA: hypothetical protein VGP72_26750 [Planctomycetota bacterium]|jgi:DNA-directed RNA polymerase subunit RPC12/RpoP
MAVELLSLSCNHCGAPLQAPPEARYLTCAHCNARLAVQRSGSAYYTSVLEKIEKNTEEAVEDLGIIRRQNDLERLDREWAMKRETYLVRGKDGSTREPDENPGCNTALNGFVVVFGAIWTCIAGAAFPPMALFGLVFIGFAIHGMVSSQRKAGEYREAKARYEATRRRLAAALDER